MAYVVYEFRTDDTLQGIADYFGIPTSELARINNIQEPFNPILRNIPNLDGKILVPDVISGGGTTNARSEFYRVALVSPPQDDKQRPAVRGSTVIGYASQYKCYIIVDGIPYYFPCFPESYTDTRNVSVSAQNIMGRSEPFQIYQNSGPREVSVSFRMHREMCQTTPIEELVAAIQSATYPKSSGFEDTVIPKVTLVIGNNCSITGIIASSVQTEWGETINRNQQYNVVTISFSVTECTGEPKTSSQILNDVSGYRVPF